MTDYVDLRDLKGEEKEKWAKAIKNDFGCDFEELAKNEPTMIPDDEFEDYAQQLAEDIGAIGQDNQWPVCCIDWEKASQELKMDYSSVEVDGVEYWFRNY